MSTVIGRFSTIRPVKPAAFHPFAVGRLRLPLGVYQVFSGAAEAQVEALNELLQRSSAVSVGILVLLSTVFRRPRNPLLVLMTALVTGLGLLPIALGSGEVGREIEGPLAIVILGGLVTSTALTLLVLPTLALRFGRFAESGVETGGTTGE